MSNTIKDLKNQIKDYLNRNDARYDANLLSWIHKAHDHLERVMRHPEAVGRVMYTVQRGFNWIPLPENVLEVKFLINAATKEVFYRASVETMEPEQNWFSLVGDRILLPQTASVPVKYEIHYYRSVPKPTSDDESNLYLIQLFDWFLYYALSEAFAYDANPSESAMYAQKADAILSAMLAQIQKHNWSGSTFIIKPDKSALAQYY
jgi:hypothetical protein